MLFFSLVLATRTHSSCDITYYFSGSSLYVKLTSPQFSVESIGKGMHHIVVSKSGYLMDPGNPKMPEIIKLVRLPSYIDPKKVESEIILEKHEQLRGFYNIEPAPPLVLSKGDKNVLNWGKSKEIKKGKNLRVYYSSKPYPEKPLKILGTTCKGKKKFLRFAYYPFRYYPRDGRIEVITEIKCRVKLGLSDIKTGGSETASGGLSELEENTSRSSQGPSLALSESSATYDYVIITSNAIVSGSDKLADFVQFKESIGHRVMVVTEDQFIDLQGPPPHGRAEKIRQWLINNYESLGIKYVLLIGDPDPSSGDVPMKKCYPRSHESSYRDTLTDYYYADLTGNWDIDGDELFGEYPDDNKPGGVDYAAEVWVGRIPVYNSDYQALDSILQKIIDYQSETGELSWRKQALLPAAILNFEDEPPSYLTRTDGAELAERLIENVLNGRGFLHTRLYEKQGLDNSTYPVDEPLNRTNVKDAWASGYGFVCAVGHGSATGIYRKYWRSDENSNNLPDSGETSLTTFFTSQDSSVLDDTHPSVVYLCSCNNGYPENTSNLGYSLLKHGAIATLSASRVSWYTAGWKEPNPNYPDNFSLGYYYLEKVAQNMPCGKALALTKEEMVYNTATIWLNLQGFNLYGDPETSLFTTYTICSADLDYDGDVDGKDLARLADGDGNTELEDFSGEFGKSDCGD